MVLGDTRGKPAPRSGEEGAGFEIGSLLAAEHRDHAEVEACAGSGRGGWSWEEFGSRATLTAAGSFGRFDSRSAVSFRYTAAMSRRLLFAPTIAAFPLLIAVLIGLGFQLAGPAKVVAQEEEPIEVAIAVHLLEVGRLDTTTGTYTMDFHLSMTCDEPCDPTNFEIKNGEVTSLVLNVDEPTQKVYRVQAVMTTNIDHREYPFDDHDLKLIIEDRSLGVEELVYTVNAEQTGIDPDIVLAGWRLDGDWEAEVRERVNPLTGDTYSEYTMWITLVRPTLAAILKGLVPGCFIVIVSFLGFALVGSWLAPRMGLQAAALTGAFLYHLNFTSSIPPTGHLTYADTFMIVNYVALILCLAVTTLILVLSAQGRTGRIDAINRYSSIAVPLIWVGLQVLAWERIL